MHHHSSLGKHTPQTFNNPLTTSTLHFFEFMDSRFHVPTTGQSMSTTTTPSSRQISRTSSLPTSDSSQPPSRDTVCLFVPSSLDSTPIESAPNSCAESVPQLPASTIIDATSPAPPYAPCNSNTHIQESLVRPQANLVATIYEATDAQIGFDSHGQQGRSVVRQEHWTSL